MCRCRCNLFRGDEKRYNIELAYKSMLIICPAGFNSFLSLQKDQFNFF